MRFFFDNNLGRPLVHALKAFGEDVMHLTEEFDQDAPDEEWLPVIGKRGDILISRDNRLRYNKLQPVLLREHRIGAFFISGKNRSRCDLFEQVVRNWRQMKHLASRPRPFRFRVPPRGTKIANLP